MLESETLDALRRTGLMRSPLSVVVFDAELRVIWAQKAGERLGSGIPASDPAGRRLGEVLPGVDVDLIEQSVRQVLLSGQPSLDLEVTAQRPGHPGDEEEVWSCIQVAFGGGEEGQPAGVIHIMREVTERARAQRRLALADEASARIGTTLDISQTGRELLSVAIPRLADAGAVDLLTTVVEVDQATGLADDEARHLQRVAMQWPADHPIQADYLRRYTWTRSSSSKLYERLATGSPIFVPDLGTMTPEQIGEVAWGTGVDRMLAARAAGAHSLIVVPLVARGAIIGVVVLYRLAGSRPFARSDLPLARDLVSRGAVSIDNARLYTRERATALALQRGLLPRQIPDVPGLELAHRYVPAQTAAEVGGDWFDVIPLPPDRCALIVGDVTGHDIRAASLMGQLRTATRTLATLDLAPAEVLTRLDLITADLTDDETGATCIYAVHDVAAGGWDISRAGHPLPAVLRPDGSSTFLDMPPGLPLGTGLAGAARYQTARFEVPSRSVLVLYTDGLIERPGADLDTGMAGLASALRAVCTLPLREACGTLLDTLAPSPADDIAILMAQAP
jgi:GAF domain-containing protein